MKMLTKANRKALLPFYTNEEKPLSEAMAVVKYFTPDSNWTWYASEGEPVIDDAGNEIDFRFFGLVDGFVKELGYFLLSELKSGRGPHGLSVERDMHFSPKSLEELLKT